MFNGLSFENKRSYRTLAAERRLHKTSSHEDVREEICAFDLQDSDSRSNFGRLWDPFWNPFRPSSEAKFGRDNAPGRFVERFSWAWKIHPETWLVRELSLQP